MNPKDFAEAETERKDDSSEGATLLGHDPLAGTLLDGRYAIKRKLGQGGFGAVYLASDEKMLSRPVVAKILHVERVEHAWSVKKFRQEVEAMTRIDHPSIVSVLDSGQSSDGNPYIIMQYVDGVSLRSQITSEGMDFGRAANIVRQIGRALTAAHDRGIFHRDLKPENIMLQKIDDGDEQVKIIDFGIAKVKDSVISMTTGSNVAAGTAAYMSPEQLLAGSVTAATDIYSCAIIAYELVTGRRPMNPESSFQLLEMQRSGVRIKPSDLRPSLNPHAEAIILKGLSFEPKQRYARAREFGDILSGALLGDDELIKAQHSESGEMDKATLETAGMSRQVLADAPKSFLKRMPVIAAGSLAIMALAIAGAWYKLRPNQATAPPTGNSSTVAVPGPELSLTYWLTVQKMLSGKPLGKPIESAGNIIFGNGWRFRLNLRPTQSGALYLLNVGPGKTGASEYNILFPLPQNGQMNARLSANQTMQSDWFQFVEHTGEEKLWIIWSTEPIPELDAIFSQAAGSKQDPGVVVDPSQIALVETYLKKYDSAPPSKVDDMSRNLTSVKGRGDIMVTRVQLKHEEV
jgi:serine/threonine protein kinase